MRVEDTGPTSMVMRLLLDICPSLHAAAGAVPSGFTVPDHAVKPNRSDLKVVSDAIKVEASKGARAGLVRGRAQPRRAQRARCALTRSADAWKAGA